MTSHTETMKTKPFNTPDTQAILAGRKTIFRELIKPQPTDYKYCGTVGSIYHFERRIMNNLLEYINAKPRFQQGDIIAVKEIWAISYDIEDHYELEHPCISISEDGYSYKADGKPFISSPWHSPVTMPREAHRLFLEVVSVNVERLRDISYNDCLKEGIGNDLCDFCPLEKKGVYNVPGPGGGIAGCEGSHCDVAEDTLIQSFASLHPDKWQRNEWVFVYKFRRVDIKQEDQP